MPKNLTLPAVYLVGTRLGGSMHEVQSLACVVAGMKVGLKVTSVK